MAIYIGGYRDTAAVRSAMQISYATTQIINPKIKQIFPTLYDVKQSVAVDRSVLYAVRTGIGGSNDLVWVGTAANMAAKMCTIRDGYATHISREGYQNLDESTTYGGIPRQNMWSDYYWPDKAATFSAQLSGGSRESFWSCVVRWRSLLT